MQFQDVSRLDVRAKQMADNWKKFPDFAWSDQQEGVWTIAYTHNRDSGLLDRVNGEVIAETMAKFEEDARPEHHRHWACGWIEGWAIRVYDQDGNITEAFKAWENLEHRMSDFPVLDNDRYSEAETEALWDEVAEAVRRVARQKFVEEPTIETAEKVFEELSPDLWYDDHGSSVDDSEVEACLSRMGFTYEEV